jgi:hypothetical protein
MKRLADSHAIGAASVRDTPKPVAGPHPPRLCRTTTILTAHR